MILETKNLIYFESCEGLKNGVIVANYRDKKDKKKIRKVTNYIISDCMLFEKLPSFVGVWKIKSLKKK